MKLLKGKSLDRLRIRGYLYNWYCVENIAASGWTCPSDNDFKILEGYVDSTFGIGDEEWDKSGNGVIRGVDNAKKLKSTEVFTDFGENEFNFSMLPGGRLGRFSFTFTGYDTFNYIWTSTSETGNNAFRRSFTEGRDTIERVGFDKLNGCSVRVMRNYDSLEDGVLEDGEILENFYQGNDGKLYDCVKIGSQIWIKTNLLETKFNDGNDIEINTVNWATPGEPMNRTSYEHDEKNAIERLLKSGYLFYKGKYVKKS